MNYNSEMHELSYRISTLHLCIHIAILWQVENILRLNRRNSRSKLLYLSERSSTFDICARFNVVLSFSPTIMVHTQSDQSGRHGGWGACSRWAIAPFDFIFCLTTQRSFITPPPPPSDLSQGGAAVAKTFALPKQTP